MNEVVYLIMRQMRQPALILLGAYSLAILGITSIPAVNSEGELSYLTIFQAFYWVSYTATTIGYGELPLTFSEWQRMWVVLSIYYTVPAWFYAIGKIIALLQDETFQHALNESRFARRVEKQRSKFCIICGFGESGQRLVRLLLGVGYQCVVIDNDPVRINKMALDSSLHGVLAINGDAFSVELLLKSGIQSPYCRAVIAITDSEEVNIKVSLAARLLSSDQTRFQIICRTYTRAGSANAKSFDTDATINTNQIFAQRLTTALRRPSIAELIARLQNTPGTLHESPPQPPMGHWIICGNDALGKTLKRLLDYEGVDCTMVDPHLPT
ncbi:MAG: NAD-binding protein, partial [Cardiobacteriaceae bacterium]|nr:NAD-binding protein [Cardiobacteriaceae bacterium]